MGLDCREYLDAKQFEFLFNWYLRRLKSEGPSIKIQPLSYDGFSDYDQCFQRLSTEAQTAYTEHFGEPVPAIALTNLFHLAELEIAGK